MHSERVRYVLVPGWYGSEDAHWQSHWQRALPNASRVEQQDWITPLRADWIAELDAEIRRQPGPVVLIAHSLGCVTVALWAAQAERRVRDQVRGALLVAPADVERESCAEALRNFREAGLDGFIDARLGDAHELVKQLPGPWDFVFQDADKDWSLNYWNALKDKLSPRACYAVDHVMHSRSPGIRGFVESAQGDARFEHRVHDMGGGDLFVVCGKG